MRGGEVSYSDGQRATHGGGGGGGGASASRGWGGGWEEMLWGIRAWETATAASSKPTKSNGETRYLSEFQDPVQPTPGPAGSPPGLLLLPGSRPSPPARPLQATTASNRRQTHLSSACQTRTYSPGPSWTSCPAPCRRVP